MPWLYGPHSLTAFGRVPRAVWRAAKAFKPAAVFTIAGSWDWSALVAQRVARGLRVPLVASFNDWFDYGWFPAHPLFRPALERRFRRFYREADLALCTCEGMRKALGPHPNAHTLYPVGGTLPEADEPFLPYSRKGRQYIVAFAGSMADWYGPMLERLVREAETRKAPVEFRFFGSNPAWTKEFDAHARGCGVYRGHLSFAELRVAMKEVDALVLPMGFEARAAQVERTSFKTKFLDYLSFQRPILVWGPEYCSAVSVAHEFDSAEICAQPEAGMFLKTILGVAQTPDRQIALVKNARRMYEDRFHPEKIHAALVQRIHDTINTAVSAEKLEAPI